jgi:hypothetical protein
MNAFTARELTRTWVETLVPDMPGLVAAHLVGGITTMPDDAPFPATKDVDVHLIFTEGSPALQHAGPIPNMLEVLYEGLIIEAGIKPVSDYASAEQVLGNPEIAHHLMLDPVLYDPEGLLAALQPTVRAEYPERRWVEARIAHERAGFERSFVFREMAKEYYGISGELSMLGYGTTFMTAVLDVAMLQAPRIGGQFAMRLAGRLDALGRFDLHERLLDLFGVWEITREQAEHLLSESAALFDATLATRVTSHPFQHKLHPHMRAYFVDSCAGMIAAGYHQEAVLWMIPFLCAGFDVLRIDGSPEQQAAAREQQLAVQQLLGITGESEMDRRFARSAALYEAFEALARQIAAENAAIRDELARAMA